MAGFKFYWLIIGIFLIWRKPFRHFFQAEDGRKGGFLYATCNSGGTDDGAELPFGFRFLRLYRFEFRLDDFLKDSGRLNSD